MMSKKFYNIDYRLGSAPSPNLPTERKNNKILFFICFIEILTFNKAISRNSLTINNNTWRSGKVPKRQAPKCHPAKSHSVHFGHFRL
jgi:hypothetical protein